MRQQRRQEEEVTPFVPAENWVNAQTKAFIGKLSFNGYVLAGNSVANMAQGIPLQGDLDFWASDPILFMKAIEEMTQFYDTINLYPSMVEMFNKHGKLPRLNLIYTNLDPDETINKFDFDYCRCYWTPGNQITYGNYCQDSIKTKLIHDPAQAARIMRKRILKAINYGYIFEKNFWMNFPELIKNRNFAGQNDWNNTTPYPIRIQDLDMDKFQMKEYKIKVTDKNNVELTLKELTEQFEKVAGMKNVKLPILLKFDKSQIDLLKKYVQEVIWKNPLSDTHYFQIKLGTNFVNCFPKSHEYSKTNSECSSESQDHSMEEQHKINEEEPLNGTRVNTKTITPSQSYNETLKVQLNQSGSAYLTISFLPESLSKYGLETFGKMWDLHPKEKHKIIMFQQEVEVSRFSKSYLNTPTDLSHTTKSSYMYSGYNTQNNNADLPEQFAQFYYEIKKTDKRYNQVIANWYENQNDYIAHHSDCQRGMIDNASICLVSLYGNDDPNGFRSLEILPKKDTRSLCGAFVIRLDHGSVVTMHGTTQDQFKHGMRKERRPVTPRISLSFRQMKQQTQN